MIPFLVNALIFLAVGWCFRNGPYLSSREREARETIGEGKRRLREAAQAADALAASRRELEALREQTYAKAAEAQAALEEAQAQVAVAQQTLRVVQAVREQTVQIMSKRWDEPVADVAEPTGAPSAEPESEAKPKPKVKVRKPVPVTVKAMPEAPAQLIEAAS